MGHEKDLTKYLDAAEVQRQAGKFSQELLTTLLDAVNNSVVILNACRQLVYANRATLELLDVDSQEEILGQRPGELFHCGHALDAPDGCGTTEYCRQCGAMSATLRGLDGIESSEECRIISYEGLELEAHDLRVRATPFHVQGEDFVIIALSDISHEKRRRALERIFFHDILNTVGGLRGFAEMLQLEAPASMKEETSMLFRFMDMLLEEIQAHKLLLAAESEELEVSMQPLRSGPMLEHICSMFAGNDALRDKQLRIDSNSQDVSFSSDATLLRRVLVNLVKNALEASNKGDVVTVGARLTEAGKLVFDVHNPTSMSREVQLQIFKRSFSTKGEGRGLGTYSVKLLAERYLGGKVSFSSNPASGTTFSVTLPPGHSSVHKV